MLLYSALAPVFSSQPKKRQQPSADDLSLAACGLTVTPACLQSLYGIPTAPNTESSNTLGVTGYGDNWANKADLESFLSQYRTDTLDGGSFGYVAQGPFDSCRLAM
ncbi:uncharacterized protein B0H18DRAFT_1023251 [Fomitopsis serialis]|uniref:uncharacterized protein n=1 Tax=Fomitopsis serialis TaxID=139415 RepID=UPI0020087810|nr:uncharacterized protein B0H18DRAFT_1023251 [Neoantrodia serialis]KAH9920666.1 hypothetical protein B0H18DRAFT_1023251 [Neoantrodia serialis]